MVSTLQTYKRTEEEVLIVVDNLASTLGFPGEMPDPRSAELHNKPPHKPLNSIILAALILPLLIPDKLTEFIGTYIAV